MQSLPIFLLLNGRPVILVGEGEAAQAKRRLIERAGGQIVGEEADARIAFVAVEDDGEARSCADRLKARGILVNAVDRPEFCDFVTPAIVDRDPVLVAVGTSGAVAGLAKSIRQRAENLLPAGLGTLAERFKALRPKIRERWPDPVERRHAIDRAFDEGGPLDPLVPHDDDAVDNWLAKSASAQGKPSDQFEIVKLRSLDPHDLTVGETLLLGRADRVFLAPGVPEKIAHRARADAAVIPDSAIPQRPGPGLSVYIAMPE